MNMTNLLQLEHHILNRGRVNGTELEALRQEIYSNGKVDRQKADFLVELHKRVQITPAFNQFFYKALKDHILSDGRIDAGEAAWLREVLFADGKIDDEERKFLQQLKGEAQDASPEFATLFRECMKQPPEQHTCG